MKNENQHFSADRRKFGRHFWIGAAVAGAARDESYDGVDSAFGGGYIYGGECGLPKESFRSENRRRKSWIKGISALYGSCKI